MPHNGSSRLLPYPEFRRTLSGANIHENAISTAKASTGAFASVGRAAQKSYLLKDPWILLRGLL